ncbi:hypothetical protein GCM10028775_19290 [Catellatospora paridis]
MFQPLFPIMRDAGDSMITQLSLMISYVRAGQGQLGDTGDTGDTTPPQSFGLQREMRYRSRYCHRSWTL